MRSKKLSLPEKWLLKGIPIIFIVASFMHFIYEFSGNNKLVGLIAPVNESVWEHTKMVLLPVILFWIILYLIYGKKFCIDKNTWFTGALTSLIVSIVAIPLLYYFYTEAFGIESVVIDIAVLFLAILFGQISGLHVYRYSKGIRWVIVVLLMMFIVTAYMILTYYPIRIPLFKDSLTGRYGIERLK